MNPLVVVATMARRAMLVPGPPHRTVMQLGSLKVWGFGLAGELRQAATRSPRSVAVIDEQRGELTYGELLAESNRVTMLLRLRGVRPGDRVGLMARNHVGAVAVMLGASALGVDLVLVNTGLGAESLRTVVEEQRLSLMIHDDEFAPVLVGLAERVTLLDETTLTSVLGAMGRVAPPRPPHPPGRTIILTSGTTGAPRGAARPTPTGFGPMVSMIDRIPLYPGDRVLVSAPLFHSWGYAALQLCLGLRAALVLQRRFDPVAAQRALTVHRCRVMFAVPIMLRRMLELPPDPFGRLPRLRAVATSGSAYPSGFATRFMDAYGDVLYNVYGSTEASWICIATPKDLRKDPRTAGTPPLGTKVRILDDDLRPVPSGVVGRVFAGNEMVFAGYTAGGSKMFHDGMVATGDLGHECGGLYFVDGRDDDMVVSGGENVYPSEVEQLLERHPAVREVAVVGVPDEEFGQRLAAFVSLRPAASLSAEDVRSHVRERLSRHTVPRDVHFVDALPRNATGKILHRDLRARLGHGDEGDASAD